MWKKARQTEFHDMEMPPMGQDLSMISSQATLGPSITIHGELTGSEDLTIQGTVEGSVHLTDHCLTVGRQGHIQANIYAKDIKVEGEVNGDLIATEQVCIRGSGKVDGNIQAKRVVLEDGCRFKGRIDMDVACSNQNDSKLLEKDPDVDGFNSLTKISSINIEKEEANELQSGT